MTAIALISTSNTVLIVLIATSRIIYGMAEEGAIPSIFGKVNKQRKTPTIAVLAAMIVAVAFCFIGGIEAAAYLTNFTLFLVFLAVNLSVLGLAREKSNSAGERCRLPSSEQFLQQLCFLLFQLVLLSSRPSLSPSASLPICC